jgi:hypothetical protein
VQQRKEFKEINMAEYDDVAGVKGQVMNESYCMKKSWQAQNVDSMTEQMGYHDMSDLANTPRPPTQMKAEKRNVQLEPRMPKANSNDRKGKAY